MTLALALAVGLTACGSKEGRGPAASAGVDPADVASCLSDKGFVAGVQTKKVTGSSPGGAVFALTFYRSNAAARAARAKKPAPTTAVVENALADFGGNPKPSSTAPALRLTAKDLAAMRACISSSS